jgi:hypothetical protein
MVEVEEGQTCPLLDVCCCCLQPSEVAREIGLSVSGGQSGLLWSQWPWCKDCWRRRRLGKMIAWLCRGVGVAAVVGAGAGAYSAAQSAGVIVIEIVAGIAVWARLSGAALSLKPFKLPGHVHACDAVKMALPLEECPGGRVRTGHRFVLGNKGFATLLEYHLRQR